jgi:hypothetical protein
MNMAFPWWFELTKVGIVAIPDGKYGPAAIPSKKSSNFIRIRELLVEMSKRTHPTAQFAITIVLWCEILEDKNPDNSTPIQYPDEISRKNVPASSCPRCKSCSIVTIKGARINLGKKLKKNRIIKKRMDTNGNSGDIGERSEELSTDPFISRLSRRAWPVSRIYF